MFACLSRPTKCIEASDACMRNETLDFPQRNVMRCDSLSTYRHTALFSCLSKTSTHAMKVFYKMPQSVILVCRMKRQFINDLFALSFHSSWHEVGCRRFEYRTKKTLPYHSDQTTAPLQLNLHVNYLWSPSEASKWFMLSESIYSVCLSKLNTAGLWFLGLSAMSLKRGCPQFRERESLLSGISLYF